MPLASWDNFVLKSPFLMENEHLLPRKTFKEVLKDQKCVLGFDIDGVLINTPKLVAEKLNKEFDLKRKILPVEINEWYAVQDFLVRKFGWEKQKAYDYELYIWTEPEMVKDARPMPGARTFTKELTEIDVPFFVYSSRKPALQEVTYATFAKWFPWIDPEQIVLRSKDNSHVPGPVFKAYTVTTKGITHHIDDDYLHILDVLSLTRASAFLLSNKLYPDYYISPRLRRVSNPNLSKMPDLKDVQASLVQDPTILYVAQS
ncbi:hypothetical protein COY29_02055 [Candidatus Woesebacteria bacterium CG_4_10_14_0_2_um_filter_39_14]|uniref:HAD family hydrolase n=1 Tax=Candidatus Woesebacteria bacterium CG_4_10_14_0_2_um_filter_39_14 TaxID=1975054 RepID=A0A2M7TP49_9BACT|nr:MAG: hypothetical protein COY29_02055 [Candidatus Woesebacteria bacterium CG_4_10_14_0_2_um_filter_39_14]